MACIHDKCLWQAYPIKVSNGSGNAYAVKVRLALTSTTKNERCVFVSMGFHHARLTIIVKPNIRMGCTCGNHCIECNLNSTIRGIFKANRKGQSTGHRPVWLALRRTCTDCSKADEVGVILVRRGVQQLGGNRQAHIGDLHQQPASQSKALRHVKCAIHTRVIYEAAPSNRRTGLFKICPRND